MLQVIVGLSLVGSTLARVHGGGGGMVQIEHEKSNNVAPHQCDRIRQAVRATAGAYCKDMMGHGKECVQNCNKMVDHMAKKMMQERHAVEMMHNYEQCWVARSQIINLEFCWPSDCKPTINHMCGGWKGKAVPGYDLIGEIQIPRIFDGCEVCMISKIYANPPIKHYGCWLNQLRVHDFCHSDNMVLVASESDGEEKTTPMPDGVQVSKFNGREFKGSKSYVDFSQYMRITNNILGKHSGPPQQVDHTGQDGKGEGDDDEGDDDDDKGEGGGGLHDGI